jgi:hypothetical protein
MREMNRHALARPLLVLCLAGPALMNVPAAVAATPVQQSMISSRGQGVEGCRDSDYGCGYRLGSRQGRSDAGKDCGSFQYRFHKDPSDASERGYADGYAKASETYCPPVNDEPTYPYPRRRR